MGLGMVEVKVSMTKPRPRLLMVQKDMPLAVQRRVTRVHGVPKAYMYYTEPVTGRRQ